MSRSSSLVWVFVLFKAFSNLLGYAVQAAILPRLLPLELIPNPYETLHDYLISAPTGSGKTLAYAIPIIEVLSQRIVPRLRALIVLPTRDLVGQVRETLEALAKGTGLTVSDQFFAFAVTNAERLRLEV